MLGLVKLGVEGGVNRGWKLGTHLPNQLDAFRLFDKKVVITLAVGEASITKVDIRAIREDKKV